MKKTAKMLISICFLIVFISVTTYAGTVKFDFGGTTATAASGYVHVDETMHYGAQSIYGLDYGILGNATADNWSGWWTRNTETSLALTGLRFTNNWNMSTGFLLEVPNGTYTVTVFAGNVAWDNTGMIMMEGGGGTEKLRYSVGVKSDNLYMVDVNPNKDINGDSDGYLTWTQDQDYTKHGNLYYGRIPTWGYNGNHPLFSAAEGLYLLNQPVTVTDGTLWIGGITYNGETQLLLNYVEVTGEGIVVPEPVSLALFGLGGLLLQYRRK